MVKVYIDTDLLTSVFIYCQECSLKLLIICTYTLGEIFQCDYLQLENF